VNINWPRYNDQYNRPNTQCSTGGGSVSYFSKTILDQLVYKSNYSKHVIALTLSHTEGNERPTQLTEYTDYTAIRQERTVVGTYLIHLAQGTDAQKEQGSSLTRLRNSVLQAQSIVRRRGEGENVGTSSTDCCFQHTLQRSFSARKYANQFFLPFIVSSICKSPDGHLWVTDSDTNVLLPVPKNQFS